MEYHGENSKKKTGGGGKCMEMEQTKVFAKTIKLLNQFRKDVLYKDRFMTDHKFFNLIDKYEEEFVAYIEPEALLYRVRVYRPDISKKDHFNVKDCFSDEDMFPPTDGRKVKQGRANPQYIRYLYTAIDEQTAVAETKPLIGSSVCIATLHSMEKLKILDFSKIGDASGEKLYLLMCMEYLFSIPSSGEPADYIPSQCIAAFIKNKNKKEKTHYDGIGYSSSLHEGGKNIVFFDPDKFEILNKENKCVTKIEYEVT